MAEQNKQMTPAQYVNQVATVAQNQISKFVNEGKLDLPKNFSAGNAIKQLQLKIQDDEKLLQCSQASLLKVMIDSVTLGLNISKNQFYVIPYDGVATLQKSYLGNIAIAKRIDPTIEDIIGKTIRKGEIFEFEDLQNGYSKIIKHTRTIESMDSDEIIGGYATIIYNDGKEPVSIIKTYKQIKEAWGMSKAKPIDEKTGEVKKTAIHSRFADDMIYRTCANAICKGIIAKSDDKDLFAETLQSVELAEAKTMADEEAKEKNGVGEFIDVDNFVEITKDNKSETETIQQEYNYKIDDITGELKL